MTPSATRAAFTNRPMQTLLSVLLIIVGVVLLIYMIRVESEPGGVPVLLLAVGVAWLLTTRLRARRA